MDIEKQLKQHKIKVENMPLPSLSYSNKPKNVQIMDVIRDEINDNSGYMNSTNDIFSSIASNALQLLEENKIIESESITKTLIQNPQCPTRILLIAFIIMANIYYKECRYREGLKYCRDGRVILQHSHTTAHKQDYFQLLYYHGLISLRLSFTSPLKKNEDLELRIEAKEAFQSALSCYKSNQNDDDQEIQTLLNEIQSSQPHCAYCGFSFSTLFHCSVCKLICYCCKDHQKKHWPIHKSYCSQKKTNK